MSLALALFCGVKAAQQVLPVEDLQPWEVQKIESQLRELLDNSENALSPQRQQPDSIFSARIDFQTPELFQQQAQLEAGTASLEYVPGLPVLLCPTLTLTSLYNTHQPNFSELWLKVLLRQINSSGGAPSCQSIHQVERSVMLQLDSGAWFPLEQSGAQETEWLEDKDIHASKQTNEQPQRLGNSRWGCAPELELDLNSNDAQGIIQAADGVWPLWSASCVVVQRLSQATQRSQGTSGHQSNDVAVSPDAYFILVPTRSF